MTIFTELKRRNVIKVASVYLVTCWLIIQVVAVITPALHIPAIFATIVTILLMIGFPFACIFAWAFELTPQGLKFTQDVDTTESISNETGSVINRVLVTALILAVGFIAVDKLYLESRSDDLQHSIAVLPFEDMSPDRSQEYFGDGIAEEILNSLARINAMTVISRTSSFRYKGSEHDIRKIGAELNVNYVLEGSVRKDKNQLRITAQLIDVESGAHIWSQTYDRELTSIFAVQDELTFAITQALQLNLLPDDVSTTVGMTNNPAAYELFVEARELSYQRSSKTSREAIALFERALAIDPDFHLARAQLYSAYLMALEYGGVSYDIAEQELSHLFWQLQIAPDFPLKWLVLATQANLEGNVEVYNALMTKAYEVAPNDPLIQNSYLLLVRDIESTIAERERILRTNPASDINFVNLHELYLVSGQLDKAAELHKSAQQQFGVSLSVLWMNLQYHFSVKHDIQASLKAITDYKSNTSTAIRSVEVASFLYLNQINSALDKLHEYLLEYPGESFAFNYSYASLLHLKQQQALTESQIVSLENLPYTAEDKEVLEIFYSLLVGDPLPFENKYNIADISIQQKTELLKDHPLSLHYLALKKRQGEAELVATLLPHIDFPQEVCYTNVVNATGDWCEGYFYLTAPDGQGERLVSQLSAAAYWTTYNAGQEAFVLTNPLYYALHDTTEGSEYLQAMLNASIEQTNPAIITRKGLN